ncbi:Fic family protein [Lentilactobacillus sp. Marseille-Q4993]|uniref:Fic family protein n=1 Tax=Lentilactobacillus sp. Marseille-Q4993 TaxID=3039492 RepID=UPI0024BD3DA5|nr:Fic family protein [Lentilactobacillus sp. Marseille-Q4993]
MDYQDLKTYKYNGSGPSRSHEEVDNEYQRRLKGFSTVVTNLFPILDIDEYKQTSQYPLFFVQTVKINALLNTITRNSKRITEIANNLPGVAKNSYIRKLLTREIYFTNEIEGVKTTKREIGTVISEMSSNHDADTRLSSTVRMYSNTILGKTYQIKSLNDIRKVYDELLKGEIAKDKLPDGKTFRNRLVYIGNETNKVHTPPVNENEIQEKLVSLISFMNDHIVMDILKAVVTHFMFENIHPFYDGNGRTGRYLLASYLASKLDTFTGLSISGSIHSERSSYYKAFKQADAAENRADVTLFVSKLLEIIEQGQSEVIEDMSKLIERLNFVNNKMTIRYEDKIQRSVMYIFAQSYIFSESVETGIIDNDLIEFMNNEDASTYKKNKIKEIIKEMEKTGDLIKVKGRPLQHVIEQGLVE